MLYWMTLPLRRYADFAGRSRRKEYWMFFPANMLAAVMIAFLSKAFQGSENGAAASNDPPPVFIILFCLLFLAMFIPMLAVQVRRLHDQDRTGWHVLLNLIPYIGSLIVLVLLCQSGTDGPNAYGPDPRDPYGADDADQVIS